jgi:GTP-binding protein Era
MDCEKGAIPGQQTTRSAFIALIGRPNSGKSTLLNTVIGEDLALVSTLPQTTRKNFKGIYTLGNLQLVFVDTPGIHRGKHEFNGRMIQESAAALNHDAADLVCYLVDLSRPFGEEEDTVSQIVMRSGLPAVVLFTKKDICDDVRAAIQSFLARYPKLASVPQCIMNAKEPAAKDAFLASIAPFIPEGPMHFPGDNLTDENMRFFAAEYVRKQIIYNTKDEVPHAAFVVVDAYRESPKRHHVEATVHVETDGQKGIIIGKNGALIKKIQRRASEDMTRLAGMPVSIICHVKVTKGWRDNEKFLMKQGYHKS